LRLQRYIVHRRILHSSGIFRRNIHRNYYDCLGISAKASQADIKKAYYKLSLQYHPDKSGEEEKFREITAAYEILGNLRLRRLYDRGMMPGGAPVTDIPTPTSTPVTTKTFEGQTSYRVPTAGRTSAYNYDEWNRAHYANVLHRQEERKKKLEHNIRVRHAQKGETTIELAAIIIAGTLFAAFLSLTNWRTLDGPRSKPPPD
jgi:DnaJ-class molecular chaperone